MKKQKHLRSLFITDITNALYELEEWSPESKKWEHVYKGLQALPNHIIFMIAKECGVQIPLYEI